MRQPRRGRASSDRQPAAGQRHLHNSRPECLSHFRRAEHRPVRFPPGWRGTLPPAASRAHAKTRVYRRGGANRHFAAPLPTGGARLLETTVPRNSTACVCAAATPGCCCGSVCGPVVCRGVWGWGALLQRGWRHPAGPWRPSAAGVVSGHLGAPRGSIRMRVPGRRRHRGGQCGHSAWSLRYRHLSCSSESAPRNLER